MAIAAAQNPHAKAVTGNALAGASFLNDCSPQCAGTCTSARTDLIAKCVEELLGFEKL